MVGMALTATRKGLRRKSCASRSIRRHRRVWRGNFRGEDGSMTVFANGLEISCKAQANKVIAAFPYVCFTPPQNPATPPGVPVPYPTFGLDGDTDKGTGTVKIGGKTVKQKNKSYTPRRPVTRPAAPPRRASSPPRIRAKSSPRLVQRRQGGRRAG